MCSGIVARTLEFGLVFEYSFDIDRIISRYRKILNNLKILYHHRRWKQSKRYRINISQVHLV